jgi:hypothetical protein
LRRQPPHLRSREQIAASLSSLGKVTTSQLNRTHQPLFPLTITTRAINWKPAQDAKQNRSLGMKAINKLWKQLVFTLSAVFVLGNLLFGSLATRRTTLFPQKFGQPMLSKWPNDGSSHNQ